MRSPWTPVFVLSAFLALSGEAQAGWTWKHLGDEFAISEPTPVDKPHEH